MPAKTKSTAAQKASPPAVSPVSADSAQRLADWAPYRFVIEAVTPEINGGRYPIKREVGDRVDVEADIIADGHGKIAVALRYRHQGEGTWHETAMTLLDNDRWGGTFRVEKMGRYAYTIDAWIDPFATLVADIVKKAAAGQPIDVDLVEARHLIDSAHGNARGTEKRALTTLIKKLDANADDTPAIMDLVLADSVSDLMRRTGPRAGLTQYRHELEIVCDRVRARYGAWYEMFWRSQGTNPTRGATIDECIARLPYIKDLAFDVVYIVPHHPIGETNRKGRNNSLRAEPGDPGSPYAIGSKDGGHTDVNPDWGTLADFRRFVEEVHGHGLEVAIDFAIQCSPDHPWIKDHHDWFKWRPDGSIKFAENPPKKYEDIVNVEFYDADGTTHKPDLWIELRDVVQFWVDQGHQDLPCRQPAHQAAAVLGVDDPGYSGSAPRRDFSVGSLHPTETDEGTGEAGFHPVLQLFHLAHRQGRDAGVSGGADPGAGQGVHARELLRQHAGHPAVPPANRRAPGLYAAVDPRRHAQQHLRHL